MNARSAVAAAAVVVTATAAVLAAGAQRPDLTEPSTSARRVPPSAALLSCPMPPVDKPSTSTSTSRIFAVAPAPSSPISGGSSTSGSLRVLAGAAAAERATTAQPRVPLRVTVPITAGRPPGSPVGAGSGANGRPAAVVVASGALAPGVAGNELSTYASTTMSGIAATRCEAPRSQWWFNGVDTRVGTTTTVHIANPGRGIAVVDLRFLGPHGEVAAAGARDLAVAPHSVRALDLAGFAPGRSALTVRVAATRGTVAAAISTTRLDGVTPTGAEWVPASSPPAPVAVVDAGVAGAAQRLVIINPGSTQQLVTARVLASGGAFAATALPPVQVPPGSVVVKDIAAVTRHRGAAIELRSTAPVTGAIVSEISTPVRDFAVSGVSNRIAEPAVVPMMPGARLTLSLTATRSTLSVVSVTSVDRLGHVERATRVPVRGGTTAAWSSPPGSAASYLVVRWRGGGAVQGVATLAGAAGVAQLPLEAGTWTIVSPDVVPLYP